MSQGQDQLGAGLGGMGWKTKRRLGRAEEACGSEEGMLVSRERRALGCI